LIQVDQVDVQSQDSTLRVKVVYTVRATQQNQQATFQRGV
jgi:hypothetical protein